MLKRNLTLLILTTWVSFATGQNLVPNYSFEIYDTCPNTDGQINYAIPWVGTNNSTDYYNVCAPSCSSSVPCPSPSSFQYAKTGNAFAGLYMLAAFAPYREYMQVLLLDTLENTKCYFIRYYVNLHNKVQFAVNNFGIYFSGNAFSTPTWGLLSYTPQILGFNNLIINDTLNWVPMEAIYTANGGERYITLGNFYDDANTDTLDTGNGTGPYAYYYFDNISIIPIDSIIGSMPALAGNDTTIIPGDSIFIGQRITNLNCNWYIGSTLIADSISGLYVSPTATTTYTVEQNLCGTLTYDTLTIFVSGVGINENKVASKINFYPNPFTTISTLKFDNFKNENHNFTLYDTQGRLVREFANILADKIVLERQNLSSGLYFFQLRTDTQIIATGKLTIE